MPRSSDYHLLLSRGRKAGLTTRELYSALATQPAGAGEQVPGQTDCNGYVPGVDEQGRRTWNQAGVTQRG